MSSGPLSFVLVQRSDIPSFMVATGDFNHDGFADVVSVNPTHDSIHFYLNRGDGTFNPDRGFEIAHARWAAVADFNGDGNLDVAVVSPGGSKMSFVYIAYGVGDGTFNTPVKYSTHVDAETVITADFNGDGRPDMAFANHDRISVMLNEGNELFAPPVFYEAGAGGARAITSGDFNGDGAPDLAVTRTEGKVDILLNQTVGGAGTGTFGPPTPFLAGKKPQTVVAADINGDGKTDLVTVNSDFRVAPISILLGNGDGTFQPRRNYFGGNFVDSLAIADFTGDGKLDIATSSFTSALRVYPGNGDGTFLPQTDFDPGRFGIFMTAADLNNDGLPDLLISSGSSWRTMLNTSNTAAPPQTPGTLQVPLGGPVPRSITFISHGVPATVALSGPGTAELTFSGDNLVRQGGTLTGDNIAVASLVAQDTTDASTISITSSSKSGVVDVNSITVGVGSLHALNAPAAILRGPCIVYGAVGTLTFDSVIDGAVSVDQHSLVPLGATQRAASADGMLTLNVIRADGMSLQSAEPLRLVNVGQWSSSDGTPATMAAPSIATLRCSGAFAASLTISGSVGAVTAGQFTGGTWTVQGNISSISADSFSNTTIAASATIGSFAIARHANLATFINGNVDAGVITKANLGTVAMANGGIPFGLSAHSIALLSGRDFATHKTFTVRKPANSAVVGEALTSLGITPVDFTVQII